jgi:hypothetical protein
MAERHFAATFNSNSVTTRSLAGWTWFDYLHAFARFLFTLFFLHTAVSWLYSFDLSVAHLIAHGCPSELAAPAVFLHVGIAFFGAALFFACITPLANGLLILSLLTPTGFLLGRLLSLPPSSPAWHAAFVTLLQNLTVIAALLIIACYESHTAYLEGARKEEMKEEIRQALTAWYDKQDKTKAGAAAGPPQLQVEEERKKEPKKVK